MATDDLSSLSFFDGFSEETLAKVRAMGETVEVEAGAVIVEQGDVGREAYLVCEGEIEVAVNGHVVATVGAGSLLGEMSLLDLTPRSATLRALTACTLIAYDAGEFHKIIDGMSRGERQALGERNARFRAENYEVSLAEQRQARHQEG